ncbi:uncharacterized protein [Macrobrachium rosenbergii]|uniref:uncharacterized protein n=1 Tax=Macrobrachium rosenbergii TaxID=79674 RepID=UPI0034D6F4E3
MAFITIVKAIVARALFAIHAFISVWKLVDLKQGQVVYWYMVAPLMFQGFEGIVSICARNGEEMKWFCPSVFLYLVSVVPPIWLMELGLNDLRVNTTQRENLSSLGGLKLDLELPIEQWVRVLEQVLLVMLLIGRWLLPKGELTREQLSQLLLAYMAMAADIIELFECFKEDTVTNTIELIYAVLGIWSWSLLQFTLVLSATHAPKPRPSINYPPPEMFKIEDGLDTSADTDGNKKEQSCSYSLKLYLNMDIIAILTTVFMQDGPFFLLRMTLIFRYKVVSYLNIFFTCKNTLVVSLQLYRLFVLCSKRRQLVSAKFFQRLDCIPCLQPPSRSSSRSSSVSEFKVKPETGEIILKKKGEEKEEEEKVARQEVEEEEEEEEEEEGGEGQSAPDTADIEETLIQLIDQIGGEKIIKELEQMISVTPDDNSDKDDEAVDGVPQEPHPKRGSRTVVEIHPTVPNGLPASRIVSHPDNNDHYKQDDNSPPDSGFQNYSSTDAVSSSRRPLRRQFEVSERTSDFVRDARRRYNDMDNGSDCASLSDFDGQHPTYYGRHDTQGANGSSTSLVDRYADGKRHGWGIIRDRYLPQKDWRGSSVPTSLHKDPWSKVLAPVMGRNAAPAAKCFGPEPQRSLWREKREVSSSMYRGSVTDLVPQGFRGDLENNRLRRTHSVGMMHAGNNFSCISESDADTMESVV